LFRVWDLFFVDGLDVLFRISLSILKISESELVACDSNSAIYIALESLPTRMWQADKLLQVSIMISEKYDFLTDTIDGIRTASFDGTLGHYTASKGTCEAVV
jgi:hypothetical protein